MEDCRALDAGRWTREGILKAGVWLSGSWAWDRDAERQEQTAALGYEVNTLDPAGPWLRSTQEHDARAGALLKDPEALEAGL